MALVLNSHLTELLDKFYKIGRMKYNGKIYDNVLNIFDELDIEDQKTLLRGALGVYASVTSTIIHEREVIDQGNSEALLLYLKKAREEDSGKPTEEKSTADKNQESDLPDRVFIRIIIGLVIGVISMVCWSLISLALQDDPSAMSNAKFYITLFELFDPR